MKAILEFDLTQPEDCKAHSRAAKATEAYVTLFEIADRLRTWRKWGESTPESMTQVIEDITDLVWSRCNSEDLE